MKIRIKEEGKRITIPLPTGLIFSKASVWIWLKVAKVALGKNRKDIPENAQLTELLEKMPEEGIRAFCDEIIRTKRRYGSFRLLEITTSNGAEVLIDL